MAREPVEDQEYWRRVVRSLVFISPFGFVLAYVLAAVQGATWKHSLLLGAVMFIGCLAAAGLFKLRGSKAAGDTVWLKLILALLARR